MSQYVTVCGSLSCHTKSAYDAIVSALQQAGYVDKDGYFVSEDQERIQTANTPDCDATYWIITIPYAAYCGFDVEELFLPGVYGRVRYITNDGEFAGGIVCNDEKRFYDMEEWAKENMPDEAKTAPLETDYDSDDVYLQDLLDWQTQIIDSFMDNPLAV